MKRSGPPQRKTTIRPGGKRLRRGRSTSRPTKAQAKRLHDVTHRECLACTLNRGWSLKPAYTEGCDAHHLLSGGRRRGHDETIGLCPYHHRGVRPSECPSDAVARDWYGPSLAHEPRAFRESYGSDDELLAMQNRTMRAAGVLTMKGEEG